MLDLGCAVGDQSAELEARGATVIGIDLNEELLREAQLRHLPNAEFRQAERDVADLCAFVERARPPRLEDAPGGEAYIDGAVVDRGRQVFGQACAGCHSNGGPFGHEVFSDDEILLATGFEPNAGEPHGAIGTHRCRSLTTNWAAGNMFYYTVGTDTKGNARQYPLPGLIPYPSVTVLDPIPC